MRSAVSLFKKVFFKETLKAKSPRAQVKLLELTSPSDDTDAVLVSSLYILENVFQKSYLNP